MMEDYTSNRFCPDEDCGGVCEPEEDLGEGGLLRYYKCGTCEMEFGYVIVRDEEAAGTCQLGIPESVRKAISIQPDSPAAPRPVFLGTIGRRP